MDVFSRYAPFIQDFIYRNGWQDLRAVQVAAGDAIFHTDQNVLLSASTAAGKTEAAFFPILTELTEDPPASIGCLYIAPLKALINDQHMRLEALCEEAGIPVWRWHGDASASRKRKMLAKPRGVLQITPESLEAMVMRRVTDLPRLFGDLRYVVIDEIHSLLRGDRGMQTLCLIDRLSRAAGVNPRRVGLSATIGDPEAAGRFLAAGSGRGTVIPRIPPSGMQWRLSMEHFYLTDPQAADVSQAVEDAARKLSSSVKETGLAPAPESDLPRAPQAADPGLAYIYDHSRGRKCLVFSNSREECEDVASSLRQYCETSGVPNRFLIHHGNLSAAFRETAEELMKDDDRIYTTCTTATLELGIDIGKLERAFQIDAPFTVSSFLQRMGRTGRRGLPQEMHFVMREEHPEARDLLPETIPWKLLQGIALVQLYLEDRWVEPPREGRLPYSLLYHQTMSILASNGETSPRDLAQQVLTLPAFQRVTQEDFRTLLHYLLEQDHIELTENGGLIVGLAGERIVNSFKFFAVFQENEEYTVRCESMQLGTICKPPAVGGKIAIAGHVWVVEALDRQRKEVYCHMIKGKVPAYFGDEPGDLHTRILERMRGVLAETTVWPYLQKNALARLAAARRSAAQARIPQSPLVCMGGSMYCLLPWLGSYSFLALERFLRLRCAERLKLRGFDSVRPYYMQFTMDASPEEFFRILAEEAEKPLDPMSLLYPHEIPEFDKYDKYLPEELVRKGFAEGVLDTVEMKTRILEWRDMMGIEPGNVTTG